MELSQTDPDRHPRRRWTPGWIERLRLKKSLVRNCFIGSQVEVIAENYHGNGYSPRTVQHRYVTALSRDAKAFVVIVSLRVKFRNFEVRLDFGQTRQIKFIFVVNYPTFDIRVTTD